ncbi:MAG: oligosaccharide flippase family protein, partial [Actinomycetota bacterium]
MRSPSRPATPGAGRGSSRPPQTAVLRRVARSGAWYWASVLTGTGGAFVVSVIVGRTLGLAGLGRFSYFTWVVRLSSTVLALGLQAMLGRFVAQYLGSPTPGHARGLVRLAIRANVLLAPVAAGSVAIFVLWRAHSPGLAFVLSIAAALALAVVQLEGVLGGVRDFSTLARAALVSAVAQVILAVSAAVVGVGWQGYLAFQALTMVVAVLVLSRGARRHTRAWRLVPLPRTEVVRVLRFAGTMGLVGLLGEVVWGRPELFFLDRYHGSGEVGLYSAALRLSTLVLALPYLAHRVLVPEFSWLLGSGRDAEMRATFQTVCKFTALIALPIGLGGAAVSDLILSVVYGQQFEGAAG